MLRPAPLFPVVASCLSLSGCFGCVIGPGDGGYEDPEICRPAGEDLPEAPKGSTIQVRGVAARADGTPLTDTILMRDPATANDVLGAIFTLGLSCLKEDLSGYDCGEWRKLTPDSQGRFSLTFPEEETHGLIFDKTFDFLAAAPAQASGLDGAAMVISAWFSNPEVNVPMKLWEPEVHLVSRDGKVQVSASPLISSSACAPAREATVEFKKKDGTHVWSSGLGALDERLLEDFDGVVTVSTHVSYVHSQVDSGYYTSAAQAFKSSAGPAPSRGAACQTGGGDYAAGTCPFTDGAWVGQRLSSGYAIVDLGADKPVSLIVLRGNFQKAELSVAADGKAWTMMTNGIVGGAEVVTPPAGTVARYLKVNEAYDEERKSQPALTLEEVSAW